ncbi:MULTISPECIES: YfaZ family outer membrane protein [unclassified Agarivorans]|uniref:YfaZ family outer membrane protein n=1 Tax=unclassified Agarivorans TaxID=2636026 RepID=UPI003D7D70DF
MFRTYILAVYITILTIPTVYASEFNFELNDDAFRAGFTSAIGPAAEVSANYMYSRPEGDLAELGIKATHQQDNHKFAIGTKFNKLWANHHANAHAVTIGGNYAILIAPDLTISGSAYYAPSVLASHELSRYYNLDARVAYSLMPHANVYLGYRSIQFHYRSANDLSFNKGFYIGAVIKF